MLNPRSPLPLYAQLAERLSREIRAGFHPPGSRLPSETQLAQTFGIGRPTVRQATDLLAARRLIERRRGAGTFVRERGPEAEVDVFSIAGTVASFRSSGLALSTALLAPVSRVELPAEGAGPLAGRVVFAFSRVATVASTPELAGGPVLIERFTLDAAVFPGLDAIALENRSLAQVVEEQFYLRPVGGRQTFSVATACDADARALEVAAGTPLLLVRRTLDFEGAPAALHAELLCRTDKVQFTQSIGGTQGKNET
ncbi:MAG: GntR family transcriptional regulator [Myxococcales bacterium]|nr:GntR family transcriptional regulator [Myxococcales bacterium]